MTSQRRFEQDLPDLLAQVGLGPRPDYRDDIVRRTAQLRQRPAWTLPERWLPMSVVTTRLTSPPRLSLRLVVLTLLIVALVAGALLFAAGSQRHLPAPFGLAANGLIAYAEGGDIYTADPVTGQRTSVVSGSAWYTDPVWARDGSKLAFVQSDNSGGKSGRLMVAAADGTGLTVVTPDTFTGIANYNFSPDGRLIAFTDAAKTLYVAKSDGSGVRQIAVSVSEPAWRPPDGAEIIASSSGLDGQPNGIIAVDPQSGAVRQILQPQAGIGLDAASLSPNGSLIAYSASDLTITGRNTYKVHVVGADGKGDHTLPMPAGATFEDRPVWSNDGKRLAVIRGYDLHNEDVVVAIVPADGSGTGVETPHHLTGCCDNAMEWAPADTAVLLLPEDTQGNLTGQMLVDPATGKATLASWAATSRPAWQRREP